MERKKKSEKKKGADPKSAQQKQEKGSHTNAKESNDYGGLPDRDLKKNLGCG